MILSFDIGGTKIAYGLVKNGKIFHYRKILWQELCPPKLQRRRKPVTKEKFIQKIIEIIGNWKLSRPKFRSLRNPTSVGSGSRQGSGEIGNLKAIALGIAGQVNFKEGSVILSPNISEKREKMSLKKILEEKFGLPIFLDNDANCFTLSEAVFGQGKKENFVVGLTIGTGIGGGIVINKKIIRGRDGFAGEFGHMILEVGGKKCICGRRGCFEAYASGRAMQELYFELTKKKKTTFEIKEEFHKKNPEAIFTVNETARWLSIGIANIVNILNPDLIILGGGMIDFKSLPEIALKNIKPWLLVPKTKTKISISNLKEKAALLGASLLATTQLSN